MLIATGNQWKAKNIGMLLNNNSLHPFTVSPMLVSIEKVLWSKNVDVEFSAGILVLRSLEPKKVGKKCLSVSMWFSLS